MFLRVEAREPWLLAGATGKRYVPDGLTGRTTLIRELRQKLERACDGEATTDDIRRRGEAAPASSSTDDPMADIADDQVAEMQHVVARLAYRRVRRTRNTCLGQVILVAMPERARETGIDGGERWVRLFCEDRRKLWLCTRDADWALRYLRDQMIRKGVTHVAAGDLGPGQLPGAAVQAGPPPRLQLADASHDETDTVQSEMVGGKDQVETVQHVAPGDQADSMQSE